MRAGKLDRRVTLMRYGEIGRDELNQPILDWSAIATVWAQQRPVRGAEAAKAGQMTGERMMQFQIRYRSDVSVKDRVVDESATYEITGLSELGRREALEIDCVAVAG